MTTARSEKIDDDVVSVNYEGIVIFPIVGQFGAIQKSDSGRVVYKSASFINNSSSFINS